MTIAHNPVAESVMLVMIWYTSVFDAWWGYYREFTRLGEIAKG